LDFKKSGGGRIRTEDLEVMRLIWEGSNTPIFAVVFRFYFSLCARALVEPLRTVGCKGCRQSEFPFVLLAHDWCKLNYASHASKQDVLQLTHATDIGYDLTTALLIESHMGVPLAPMQVHLKTEKALYNSAQKPPRQSRYGPRPRFG
jgi:hypothetical protein